MHIQQSILTVSATTVEEEARIGFFSATSSEDIVPGRFYSRRPLTMTAYFHQLYNNADEGS